jgi:phage major head subunit gpT-like protein
MSTLLERNQKVIAKALKECNAELSKSLMTKFGEDVIHDTKKWNFSEGKVSFKKLEQKLMEADSASSFTQFLRAGLQQVVNGMYQATPVTYSEWVTVVQSQKDTEIYAPNHGVAFPRQVGRQELYPEVGAAALDLELKNLKFGAIYALEKELLNDDQSGTFAQQAGMLGEYMAILTEVLCYGKLASVANMKYIDYSIPVSETKPSYESNYPWTTAAAPFRGGGYNKPASYNIFTQTSFQAARVALMNQKNLQGIKMMVNPKRIIAGTNQELDVKTVLNSTYYPQGAAAAGGAYGAFAVNVLKGAADVTISRFMFKQDGTVNGDSKAWYLVDDSKPFFICQMREPVSITQEDPNSGKAFEQDVIRFKGSSRMNSDFIDPRFAFIGNDGSVTT